MSCIPALSDGGDKYCLIVVVLDFLSCPIHTELLQRVDLLGEEEEEEEEEEYSRDHDTMMDSMDMCFHKLSSEGENHFKQCLKHCVVSRKPSPMKHHTLWREYGSLWECLSTDKYHTLWREYGWLWECLSTDKHHTLWREYGSLWECLSTIPYGESMAGYGNANIDRAWRDYGWLWKAYRQSMKRL